MIRALGPGDEVAIDRFLAGHAASSMFLRSNLRTGGIVDRGQPFQGSWFAAFDGGTPSAVVCHGWNGMLLLQAPVQLAALVDAAVASSGRAVAGLTGPWPQVEAARAHLGLVDRPAALDGAEDLFQLDLDRLVLPEILTSGDVRVRRAERGDAPVLIGWREAYEREILPGLPDATYAERAREVIGRLTGGEHLFVAEESGALVAMTAFNAVLPDTVQIGGVFTPRSVRCRGHGRAAVAGSLLTAQDDGVVRAILFTDSDNVGAQRAYRALGFEVVGAYGVVMFR